METFSTEKLNVGDKVIVHQYALGIGSNDYVGFIEKKTPTGLVDVKVGNTVERFKQYGAPYAKEGKYSRYSKHLDFWTEEKELQISHDQKYKIMLEYLNREVKFSKMSYDDVEQIYNLVKSIEQKQ